MRLAVFPDPEYFEFIWVLCCTQHGGLQRPIKDAIIEWRRVSSLVIWPFPAISWDCDSQNNENNLKKIAIMGMGGEGQILLH